MNNIGSEFDFQQHNNRLAPGQPESLQSLADHIADSTDRKLAQLYEKGISIMVLDPLWCREHADVAGQLHANLIVETYGNTYALPNKDPKANEDAIDSGVLDVYLMYTNDELSATACRVDTRDGRAELGRAAGKGGVGGSIILNHRILEWLTSQDVAERFHTLFATLRTAPDRLLENDFVMRGGQAITEHWRKFPSLRIAGFGPLYLKHGALEQFALASLSRSEDLPDTPLYVDSGVDRFFIGAWHEQYELPPPNVVLPESPNAGQLTFEAHYPPKESGLTELVHADIVAAVGPNARTIEDAVDEAERSGSPFTQVVVPIDQDTITVQRTLRAHGFQVFGYQNATADTRPSLLFGKVRPEVDVVPTAWTHHQAPNPFWTNHKLQAVEDAIVAKWQ